MVKVSVLVGLLPNNDVYLVETVAAVVSKVTPYLSVTKFRIVVASNRVNTEAVAGASNVSLVNPYRFLLAW